MIKETRDLKETVNKPRLPKNIVSNNPIVVFVTFQESGLGRLFHYKAKAEEEDHNWFFIDTKASTDIVILLHRGVMCKRNDASGRESFGLVC